MIFILWFVFSVLVGIYAKSKGRTGIGFFLISLLTFPLIGFIVVLIVGPVESKIQQKLLDSGELKKCPSCAELVKFEAKICKHCRTELT